MSVWRYDYYFIFDLYAIPSLHSFNGGCADNTTVRENERASLVLKN